MAVVFPYVKNTTWADGSGGGTPDTAAKKNLIEDGIFNAHNAPVVSVTRTAVQSIPNNAVTTVAFNTESGGLDQAGGASAAHHDTVTNNSRLTAVYAGIYLVMGTVRFAANATGRRELYLNKAATTLDFAQVNGDGTISWPLKVSRLISLAVSDYVELQVYQNSGGALDLSQAAYTPWFEMVRVA